MKSLGGNESFLNVSLNPIKKRKLDNESLTFLLRHL